MCFPLHASACMHASVCGLSSRTERARDCPLVVDCVFNTYQVLVVQGGSGHKCKRDACLSSSQGLQRTARITHKSHFTSKPLCKSACRLCRSSLLNPRLSRECYKCSILPRHGRANRTARNHVNRPDGQSSVKSYSFVISSLPSSLYSHFSLP